jgi:hypothetical protein
MRDLSTILDGVDRGEKYFKKVIGIKDGKMDVYAVIKTYEICSPEMQHALKKILFPGIRGVKSEIEDLKEAISSIVDRIEDLEGKLVSKDVGYIEGDFHPPKVTIYHPDDPRSSALIPPGEVCWTCRKVIPGDHLHIVDSNGNRECWACHIKNKVKHTEVKHSGVNCKVCKKNFPEKDPAGYEKYICDKCIKTPIQPG